MRRHDCMGKKTCTKCGEEKPSKEFHWRSKKQGQRVARCKTCLNEISRENYASNSDLYKKKAKKWDTKNYWANKERCKLHLSTHPCVDCGETDVAVLTFDHVRGTKTAAVSSMIGSCSWEKVQKEIEKCDVRCWNCHMRKDLPPWC